MYIFFQKGIRGGYSANHNRNAEANNKYMRYYDSSKEDSYIVYLGANNLYGWAMSQKLPHSKFEWVTSELYDVILISDVDGEVRYVLEIDLDYHSYLHDTHLDFLISTSLF